MNITPSTIRPLALGMELLGSGGGGSAAYQILLLEYLLKKKQQSLTLTPPNNVSKDALILPVAYIGAPIVCLEQLQDGSDFETLLHEAPKIYGKKPDYLLSAEIGGSNGLTALIGSAITGIPVIDADLIGRAFPCIQMASTHLAKIPIAPAFICDAQGNSTVIYSKDATTVENIARHISIAFGSNGLMSLYPLSGKNIQSSTISHSLSHAYHIGSTLCTAQNHTNPIAYLNKKLPGSRIIAHGYITDIHVTVSDGFTRGTICITTSNKKTYQIAYQNEYLKITDQNGTILATTPDIITLLDTTNLTPILSDQVQFGMQVTILTLPAADCWYTPEGLSLVGPQVFFQEQKQ